MGGITGPDGGVLRDGSGPAELGRRLPEVAWPRFVELGVDLADCVGIMSSLAHEAAPLATAPRCQAASASLASDAMPKADPEKERFVAGAADLGRARNPGAADAGGFWLQSERTAALPALWGRGGRELRGAVLGVGSAVEATAGVLLEVPREWVRARRSRACRCRLSKFNVDIAGVGGHGFKSQRMLRG
jgi:hypothetical protein